MSSTENRTLQYEQSVVSLEARLQEEENAKQQAEERSQQLVRENADLEMQLSQLRLDLKKDLQQDAAPFIDQLEAQKTKVADLMLQLANSDAGSGDRGAVVSAELTATVKAQKADVKGLKKEIKGMLKIKKTIDKTMKQYMPAVAKLQADSKAAEAAVVTLRADGEVKDRRISELERALAEAASNLKNGGEAGGAAAAGGGGGKVGASASSAGSGTAASALDDDSGSFGQVSQLKDDVVRLNGANADLTSKLSKLQDHLNQRNAHADEVYNDHKEMMEHLEEDGQHIEQLEDEVRRLRLNLSRYDKRYADDAPLQ